MKKIAVITGASSGMGRRFAETVDRYGRFDEVWVIARHQAQLEALKATVPFPIRVLALDLTGRTSFGTYAAALAEEQGESHLLLQRGDQLVHAGGRVAQHLGGAGEAACFGSGEKGAAAGCFHDISSFSSC